MKNILTRRETFSGIRWISCKPYDWRCPVMRIQAIKARLPFILSLCLCLMFALSACEKTMDDTTASVPTENTQSTENVTEQSEASNTENWWGTTPMIINTLLESYNFSGKTVVPYATSGGTGIGQSISDIRSEIPDADVKDGLLVKSNDDIIPWLQGMGLYE